MILSIYEDRQGTLWTGNVLGLGRFEPESGIFHHFKSTAPDPRIYSILEDKRGRFWLGSDLTFDRGAGTFTRKSVDDDVKGRLSTYEDRQGNIWFSALAGLRKLDRLRSVSRDSAVAQCGRLERRQASRLISSTKIRRARCGLLPKPGSCNSIRKPRSISTIRLTRGCRTTSCSAFCRMMLAISGSARPKASRDSIPRRRAFSTTLSPMGCRDSSSTARPASAMSRAGCISAA